MIQKFKYNFKVLNNKINKKQKIYHKKNTDLK